MDRPRSVDSSSYGLITIEDRSAEGLRFRDERIAGGVVAVPRHRYSWRPPLDISTASQRVCYRTRLQCAI